MRYIALSFLVLTSCANTPQLSPEAQAVRIIAPTQATPCAHLGMMEGFGPRMFGLGGLPLAQIKIRNNVAKAGGNALVIASQVLDNDGHATIVGDAYRC